MKLAATTYNNTQTTCNILRTDTDIPCAGATLREQLDQEKLVFFSVFFVCIYVMSVVFCVGIYFNGFWSFYGPTFF
jgi:hypothetical protein